MKYHLLFTGLGAGNIGDEAMLHGFLSSFSLQPGSSIEVWDKSSSALKQFSAEYNFIDYKDEEACREACLAADAVLLVGDTPLMEKWGIAWPLGVLSPKLEFCHQSGIRCEAIGVGADLLETSEALDLFRKGFLQIKSWTVRSWRSRKNLIALGVAPEKIKVGADLAWLTPLTGTSMGKSIDKEWAKSFLNSLGVNIKSPLIGINVVNELWKDNHAIKEELAKTLDYLIESKGWQVAFFCNETREGEYFDREASLQVASLMKTKAILVPNNYFTPQEMISLLSCCLMTLSWRYHFTLFSYLAGTASISVLRGEKLQELVEDTGGECVGSPEDIKNNELIEKIEYVYNNLEVIKAYQRISTVIMQLRSRVNHYFSGTYSTAKGQEAKPAYSLASVNELASENFSLFMQAVNLFAKRFGLREFSNWSKVWEYPWLWFNGLSKINWIDSKLLDMGSELSPMPWFLASLGARVTLAESDPQWIPVWEQMRIETGLDMDWQIVKSETLPFSDGFFDVVTSFSVVEHQEDKLLAVNEIARVLKPEGLLAISFDICEPELGMTFPEWNGNALTMDGFEELIWKHPQFVNGGGKPVWNVEDVPEFLKWHMQSAPHHNYTVGAAILKKEVGLTEDIKKILIPRFDTLGDIVLLEGFIEALIEKFPQAEIVFLVREGYNQLASLFPGKLRWITTTVNPYKNLDEKSFEKLAEFSAILSEISCDLLLITTYNRTWLDDVVAAMLPGAIKVAVGMEGDLDGLRKWLFEILKLEARTLYNKVVYVDEYMHEAKKYQILWDSLFKDNRKLSLPRLEIPQNIENKALAILAELGLEGKKFFVCAPAGTQNVSIKAWPVERFAEAVLWITHELGFCPLIVCHESERDISVSLSKRLEEKGVSYYLWMGKDGELPILAALMKRASFYIGNDSGPMHIAAAVGTPAVGIFGGGHWPRFLPVGPHSIGLTGEFPCFGCGWDCVFGDAPCVSSVEVTDVQKAIRHVLQADKVEINMQYASSKIEKETLQYMEKAAAVFKAFNVDRAARLEAIYKKDLKLQESLAESAARLEAIYERDRRLQESEANSAARLEAIHERDRRLQAMYQELQNSEADRAARLEAIHERDRKLQESEKQVQQLLKATTLLPIVSVITPVFNGARWIEECIKSVLQQEYLRIEHIIVDGGSTDGTLDICRKYPHLIVHSKKDRGQSHAINKGFAMARGEILAWLCADDVYEAGAVEAAVKGILSGHSVVMGYSRFIDAEGNVISEHPANAFPYYNHDMFLRFWQYNPVSQPAIFWTRKIWELCGPVRENLYFAMDYDLWLRMSLKARFERVDIYAAKYRVHPEAKCFADNYGSRIELINVSRQYWPSRWKSDYWRLWLKYKITTGAITQHYADAEKLLDATVASLNSGKRLTAVADFAKSHLRHWATPMMPGYPLLLKRILGEGIGPLWLWSFMKRVYYKVNLR